MEKEISEGNRLIVEFMGGKFVEKYRQDGHDYDMFDLPASFPIKLSDPDIFGMKRTGYLGFHCQWDWLIPVVEKIKEMRHSPKYLYVRKFSKPYSNFDRVLTLPIYSPIESVWKSVVTFVEWYNEQYIDYQNKNK